MKTTTVRAVPVVVTTMWVGAAFNVGLATEADYTAMLDKRPCHRCFEKHMRPLMAIYCSMLQHSKGVNNCSQTMECQEKSFSSLHLGLH